MTDNTEVAVLDEDNPEKSSISLSKSSILSLPVISWGLAAIFGVILPLFTQDSVYSWITSVIASQPTDTETGHIFISSNIVWPVLTIIIVGAFYIVVATFQLWLSAVRKRFILTIPFMITVFIPFAIALIGFIL